MLRIPALLGAAALFISVSAFAQTATSPSDNSAQTTSSAPAASSDTSGDMTKHKHHAHHANRENSTDMSADKLNACMPYATPTASQETCLKQASQS